MSVAFQSISSDPCYNYESLDCPWRANNESGDWICDESFSWSGWYRLFYNGMNIQMSETCVNSYSCNAYVNLWLNGPHPQIEDGVVTREVCAGSYWNGCCEFKTKPIRVKACPDNYYVYELVNPQIWCAGYCTDYDPCNNYNTLDNYRRSTLNNWYWYGYINGHDDTRVEWDGWYRLFINGSSAQMPEWCFYYMSCGGYISLWLGGSHPQLEDGVVTREIYGSHYDQCSYYRSEPIQVKACPGSYYVYKFTRPTLSIPAPVYCAVSFTTPSVDPCYNYTSLDEPWRATDNLLLTPATATMSWMTHGEPPTINIPLKQCVTLGCGTNAPLWLNGGHPTVEDGVVTRDVCGHWSNNCCYFQSNPIKVKACPGDYYVYEFVSPPTCYLAYCADAGNINATSTTVMPETTTTETTTTDNRNPCFDISCSENERCGIKNGVYGCLCEKDHHRRRQRHDSFDFSETCESSSGSMSVSRCQLFEAGFPAN
ncbi:hypothetical protein QQF64_005167 [Cirrhinus molitorella]|uniref:UMOD/GP2/OIT3-like D8C domain-containing protein n=1 Tax=Cirrhinus molitorella TaxID=172907 RepID=A0ABR3MIC6_9TELE